VDLTRSKSEELVLENALLRQQLIVLQRQTKRPALTCEAASNRHQTVQSQRVGPWRYQLSSCHIENCCLNTRKITSQNKKPCLASYPAQSLFFHAFCPFIAPKIRMITTFGPLTQANTCAILLSGVVYLPPAFAWREAQVVWQTYLTILFRYGIFGGGKS